VIAILIAQLLIFIVCASISAQPIGKVDINKDQKVVKSRFTTLTINAKDDNGIKRMCVSNTDTCNSWQGYERDIFWVFPEGNGVKTVHVWTEDMAGNVSHTTDYIRLEE